MVLLPRQIYLSPMDFYGNYGHNGGKLHHLKKMSGAATVLNPPSLLRPPQMIPYNRMLKS